MANGAMQHVPELDGIRGWACLSVIVAHVITAPIAWAPKIGVDFIADSMWFLLSGVDLFFVLSGFLIGGILIDSKGQPGFFRAFWIRRATRILPVAYILLASFALALYVQSRWPVAIFDQWLLQEPSPPLWSFALFVQNFFYAVNGAQYLPRWTGITWSLAIEEQFYVLFPLAVYFLARRNLVALVLAGIFIAPTLRYLFELFHVFPDWYGGYVMLPSRMDGLFYGVGVALIVRSRWAFELAIRFRRPLDFVALILLFIIWHRIDLGQLWPSPNGSELVPLKQSVFGIMWAIVILRVYTGAQGRLNAFWRNPWLGRVGLISYGLYMYHQAVNGLIFNQIPTIATPADWVLAISVIAVSVGVACVSYVVVELPIRRWGRDFADSLGRPSKVQPAE